MVLYGVNLLENETSWRELIREMGMKEEKEGSVGVGESNGQRDQMVTLFEILDPGVL